VDDGGLDVDALAQVVGNGDADRRAVVYTIATCQSPTGTILARDRRHALAALANSASLWIVQDDTYGEIVFGKPDPEPLIGLAPARTVHVGSFSKTLAPGLRLGWFTAPAPVCTAIAERRTDLGTTPIVQRAVGRLFDDGRFEPHRERITRAYREKRDVVVEALDQHCAGIATWTVPDGGFFVWLGHPDADVRDVERRAADVGVTFLGGPYFSAGTPRRDHLRLAYGELPIEVLGDGVRRLATAIGRASAKTPGG
jgi:DNA-binding transcriptional MocR family regulator